MKYMSRISVNYGSYNFSFAIKLVEKCMLIINHVNFSIRMMFKKCVLACYVNSTIKMIC